MQTKKRKKKPKGSQRPLTTGQADQLQLPKMLAYLCGVREQPPVVDFLFIKQIEKHIGRKLTEGEIEEARFGELVFLEDRVGMWDAYHIPTYSMPSQIQTKLKDITAATVFTKSWNKIKAGCA